MTLLGLDGMTLPDHILFSSGWEDLLKDQQYFTYHPPEHVKSWLQRILAEEKPEPGVYAVIAPPHYGKTALIRHLWKTCCDRPNWRVVGYVFRKVRRTSVHDAISQINLQLSILNITSINTGNPIIAWRKIDDLASCLPFRLVCLIDALDESDQKEWTQLDHLLPTFRLKAITLIVTSRLPFSEYWFHCANVLSDASLFHLESLHSEDITGLLGESGKDERSVKQILDATQGHPAHVTVIARSGDPKRISDAPLEFSDLGRIARHDLYDIEQLADHNLPLLRQLLALLAVAPADLSLTELYEILNSPDLEQLKRLCDRLARHIKAETPFRYRLRSPFVRTYILEDARQGGIYQTPVTNMRAAVARWYRSQYEQVRDSNLSRLPKHVLRYAPRFLLDADAPESFHGELIFTDHRWIAAIWDSFDSFADLYDTVRDTLDAIEDLTYDAARILGATTCTLVLTLLIPAFRPEEVADLVRRDLIREEQARRYARTYRSPEDRERLEDLLKRRESTLEHNLRTDFDELQKLPPSERSRRLHELHFKEWKERHRGWAASLVNPLLETLRGENEKSSDQRRQGGDTPDRPLVSSEVSNVMRPPPSPLPPDPQLQTGHPLCLPDEQNEKSSDQHRRTPPPLVLMIEQLEKELSNVVLPPLLLSPDPQLQTGYTLGLPDKQIGCLSEIANYWSPNEPFKVDYYLRLIRMFVSISAISRFDAYCDALRTLVPAIWRVFGREYTRKLETIVEAVNKEYFNQD